MELVGQAEIPTKFGFVLLVLIPLGMVQIHSFDPKSMGKIVRLTGAFFSFG